MTVGNERCTSCRTSFLHLFFQILLLYQLFSLDAKRLCVNRLCHEVTDLPHHAHKFGFKLANGVRWGCQPSTRPPIFHFFQAPKYYVFALFYYVKVIFFTFFYYNTHLFCTFLLHIVFFIHNFTYSCAWRP